MSAPEPPASLVKALKKILRPLVRLLLEYGITYPYLSNLLKNIFVEVVHDEMQVDGKRQTLSRISVVSGVHRKDVKRILEEPENTEPGDRKASLGARLLGIWLGDPRYLDQQHQPLPLPRMRSDSSDISFEQLVESINKDVRPRAVLDEWLRAGLVTLNDADQVVLETDAFVTEKNFDERAHFFGRNLRDHVAAGAHNLMPGVEDKFFERAVFYDQLTHDSVTQLKTLSGKVAMEALQKVNEEALRLSDQDEGKPDASYRMTMGTFFYQKNEEDQKQGQ